MKITIIGLALACAVAVVQAQSPAARGTIVVHATQSRENGQWNERAIMRLCPHTTSRKGPGGEVIEWMAIAASKPCPQPATQGGVK